MGVALLAGLIASAAFHPFNYWFAMPLGLLILYKLNQDRDLSARIKINLFFGIAFQIIPLYWIGTYVGNFAWIALVLMQATFFIVLSFSRGPIAFAAAWILFEFVLRSFPFGGFGWNRIGFALHDSPLNYLYPRIGIVGVAFIVVLLASLLVEYRIKGLAISAVILISLSMIPVNITSRDQIDLALIQGGQTQKMDNTFENSEGAISRHFQAMSTVKPNTVDLVIWPENAIMHDPLIRRSTRETLLSESKRISAPILVNGNLANGTNGSVLVGDGENQSYSKRYLTPFGEFIPFQSLVSKITDKASKVVPYIAGTDPYLFKSDQANFRTLICYELLSDKQARSEMSDTDFIVTQTNNATYFKTWQLDQELSLAQARSAETYRQTAYVSTTGGTSLIDEKGRIIRELPQYENGALIGEAMIFTGITPAVRYGSLLELGLLLLWLFLAIREFQRRFKKAWLLK